MHCKRKVAVAFKESMSVIILGLVSADFQMYKATDVLGSVSCVQHLIPVCEKETDLL